MEHYSDRQWVLLQKGSLDATTAALLRDHLSVCPACQQRYLKLISPRQEELADQLVPLDFTAQVMARLCGFRTETFHRPIVKRSMISKRFWQQLWPIR